jgi:preprotein translocase subunit SecF
LILSNYSIRVLPPHWRLSLWPLSLENLRERLSGMGFDSARVQTIGEITDYEFLINVGGNESNLNSVTQTITDGLTKEYADSGVEIRKTDIVGPKAGEELRNSGIKAMVYAILVIMIYVGLRFDFQFAPGAVLALAHDVIIVLGLFVILQKEFSLQIVAALLAIIGYSVNDTVIVYDRVREIMQNHPGMNLAQQINKATNETLSRTILTSGTTLSVCLAMYIWGGESIQDFFLAMSAGILIGTYSSIFVAAPITLIFDKFANKKT